VPPRALTANPPTNRAAHAGVRASGDTDYTYVKLVFDAGALKLPQCPTQAELEKLGLAPPPAPPTPSKIAGKPLGGPGTQQQQQQQGAQAEEGELAIKTLGDSRLAAAIAALTAEPTVPMRAEAITAGAARRLLQPNPQQEKITLLPNRPRVTKPSMMVNGLMNPLSSKDSKDPFAGLISHPASTTYGAVSVVRSDPSQSNPLATYGSAPTITLTFFFGMSANKTFAYGKGYNVHVPADGVKFNIEAANWWVGGCS